MSWWTVRLEIPVRSEILAMPCRCPACRNEIHHTAAEDRPRPGESYRCHICRLELVWARDTDKLTVTPVPDEDANKTQNRRST